MQNPLVEVQMTAPPPEAVRAELERVLGSRTFARAQSLGRLLRYLVERTLLGQADSLKEFAVGAEALGRGESFDPDADPIVRVQARRLRQKLEDYYRNEGLADPVTIEIPTGGYVPKFSDRPVAAPASPPSRRKVVGYAASILAGAAGGSWLLFRGMQRREADVRWRSIAVLPFKNVSGDPAQEYFADGLTEVLIADLSRLGSLRVLSRTSAMSYKGSSRKLAEIARDVSVDAVVEGSVLQSDGKVRITVQLFDAVSDRNLWAETYERDVGDTLRLQKEIVQLIASEIRVSLTPLESDQLASARRVDPDVLRLYLEARYYASQLRTEAIEKSAVLYQQAIEKGPEFAPAHAGLALSHIFLCGRRLAPSQTMPRARASALRALQLDERLAEAHAALGWVSLQYDWDWNAADWHIGQAIRLNPGLPFTHQLRALYFGTCGEHDKAISEALLAQELDPLSLFAQSHVQFIYFVARDFEKAARAGRSILEREPKFASGHLMTALALERLGRGPEAMDHFRTAAELDRDGYLAMSLARGYAVLGPREEAYHILDKMTKVSKTAYVCAYEVASAYAALGEADKAFEWLRKAVRDRSECLVWARNSPALDPVRSDPRFELLLRQAGFKV
ncbi:MAG: hypothetical protein JNN08_27640 [Bryobacterales bacterium]|nr:hypothetical protein [Bryobacterales bacterium]